MTKQPDFERRGKSIRDVATGKVEQFKSIGAAKRWSHIWQKANGGLGVGRLVAVVG